MEDLNTNLEGLSADEVQELFIKLLSMPEEQFSIIAPAILDQYQRSMSINDQLAITQAIKSGDFKPVELNKAFEELFTEVDKTDLSDAKKSFIIQLLSAITNSINASEGVANKIVTIAYEICNDEAKTPAYAHISDSGMDVYALEDITINPGETKLVPIGIKMALPPGYELQVRPKSGRCLKTKLRVANAPGTIDAGYRDEIAVIIDNIDPPIRAIHPRKQIIDKDEKYESIQPLLITEGDIEFGSSYTIGKGEKFAQLVLMEVPKAVLVKVDDILKIDSVDENRGGGFGSTGLN